MKSKRSRGAALFCQKGLPKRSAREVSHRKGRSKSEPTPGRNLRLDRNPCAENGGPRRSPLTVPQNAPVETTPRNSRTFEAPSESFCTTSLCKSRHNRTLASGLILEVLSPLCNKNWCCFSSLDVLGFPDIEMRGRRLSSRKTLARLCGEGDRDKKKDARNLTPFRKK